MSEKDLKPALSWGDALLRINELLAENEALRGKVKEFDTERMRYRIALNAISVVAEARGDDELLDVAEDALRPATKEERK